MITTPKPGTRPIGVLRRSRPIRLGSFQAGCAAEEPRFDREEDDTGTGGYENPVMRSHVSARTRLLFAFAAGLVTSALAMFLTPWEVAALAGWDVAAVIFEVWVWLSIWPLNGEQSAFISTVEDDSRAAAGIVLIAASIASLVGVGFELLVAARETGTAQGVMIAFAFLSVLLSWLAVHTVFTLRYAHEYHREGRGIDFKEGERLPDYRDFAYVAFTIGMTFQVSDTDVTSFTIRRTVLRHALLSYLFGMVIVAVTINVVAGLLK